MANWCRGIIEIKGKGKDIKRFLVETLGGDAEEITDTGEKIVLGPDRFSRFKGTKSNTIEGKIEFEYSSKEIENHFKDNRFMASWYVDPEPYVVFSKEYNLGFLINVVDIVGGLQQEVFIRDGKVVKDITEEFYLE